MKDVLDKLADDIKASTIKACAAVTDIQLVKNPTTDAEYGHNAACVAIKAMILRLGNREAA